MIPVRTWSPTWRSVILLTSGDLGRDMEDDCVDLVCDPTGDLFAEFLIMVVDDARQPVGIPQTLIGLTLEDVPVTHLGRQAPPKIAVHAASKPSVCSSSSHPLSQW